MSHAPGHDHPPERCRELALQLSEYVDGELPAALRAEIEAHNEACARCQEFVESLRRVKALAALLPDPELPGADLQALAEAARRRLTRDDT